MRIVLTDKDLGSGSFPSDVQVIKIGIKNLSNYNGNEDVVAIAGSRAMAIETAKMNLPGLKLFQLTSAGFDGVPTPDFRKKGVSVANAGSVYSAPIAETVILGMLLMAKRLHKNPNNRRIKIERHYDATISEVMGKKILIMGTGNIGTAIASRLQGFEAIVDGYNRSASSKPQYSKILSGRVELQEHIGEYDYIISTLPDTDETRGFINAELMNKMSSNAVIINVGRKAVFNEEDLYQALKNGKINGAVLDMFEKIPNPISNKFRRLHNTIVMPGVSAISKEVNSRLRELMEDNVGRVLTDKEPRYVIN